MSDDERLRLEMELEKLRMRLESIGRERVSLWSRITGVNAQLVAKELGYKPVK